MRKVSIPVLSNLSLLEDGVSQIFKMHSILFLSKSGYGACLIQPLSSAYAHSRNVK